MNLDQPWKIAALVGVLALLRVVWGLWRGAPARRFMVELLDSGLIAFLLVFVIIRPFVVQAFYIPSDSMVPTLMGPWDERVHLRFPLPGDQAPRGTSATRRSRSGDRILVNKFVYRLNAPQRGDIVVFRAPPQALMGDGKKDFVKRLIGLPGDRILIKRGDGVYVNGKRLIGPHEASVPDYDWPVDEMGLPTVDAYQVPSGCYFVLGDNRNLSRDSHIWSDQVTGEPKPYLEGGRVLGKAVVIFWPPTRIRLLSDNHQVRLAAGGTMAHP